MHFDRSLIGKSSPPQTFQVALEAVRNFMEATEDPALQSKEPLQYAPPTFPTTFRIRVPDLELDSTTMQLLHGEQQYTYERQLRIGEQVTCVAHITHVRERHGKMGMMAFIITETVALIASNKLSILPGAHLSYDRNKIAQVVDKPQGEV